MSVVHVIDTVTEWAQQNVCNHIMLKVPPKNEDAVDASYDYETANPTAFPMYVPTSEKLPPTIRSPFPHLCVRFLKGADALSAGSGHLDIQLVFSVWNPGTHGRDQFLPDGNGGFIRQGGDIAEFIRDANGWRDVWNFVDLAMQALKSTTTIGNYVIDQETPIEFGPLAEQEAIPDYYPFWFAWISFRLNYPLMRKINNVQEEFL